MIIVYLVCDISVCLLLQTQPTGDWLLALLWLPWWGIQCTLCAVTAFIPATVHLSPPRYVTSTPTPGYQLFIPMISLIVVLNDLHHVFLGSFLVCSAHNTRVVWAWTWASRSAQVTTLNRHRHAAAELHTVQTHCPPVHDSVSLTRTHTRTPRLQTLFLVLNIMSQFSFLHHFIPLLGSANNVQYRTERIKIPSTPRYPRSMLGSDRGTVLTFTHVRLVLHLLKPMFLLVCVWNQAPSHTLSVAVPVSSHLHSRHSIWRLHPLPAVNHKAPFPLYHGSQSALCRWESAGKTGITELGVSRD